MTQALRKTGIDLLGDIPWGTHLCQFYQSKKDLLELLVPYFKSGLENNEYCLWITCDPVTVKNAFESLQQAIPDFEQYLERKSIEILAYKDWYLKSGKFNGKIVSNAWIEKLQSALDRGYEGMRVNGNETWLESEDWDNFMDYEKALNNTLRGKRMIVICTYPLSDSRAEALLDVAHAHECVISRRKGKWEILEESSIKKAKAQLKRNSDELEIQIRERNAELERVVEKLMNEIVERDKIEALINSEKKLSNEIIASIPGLFALFDEELRFVRWNKNFEDVSGYTPQEILKLHGIESFFDNENEKKRVAGVLNDIIETGSGSSEVSPLMKDGKPIHLFFIGRSFKYEDRTYLITTGIDITPRKKAEEELRLAYKRLSYHVENTPLAVIEWDRELVITRWSEQAEKIFGWTEAEALGKNIYDPGSPIIYKDDQAAVSKIASELLQGLVDRNLSLNRNYTKDGRVIYCEWYNSALRDEQGNVITILSLTHDVTERKLAELQLSESYNQIRLLTGHLEKVREEERANIAREIHDELGQHLTAIKMDLARLNKKMDADNMEAKSIIEELLTITENTVHSVRRISSELRPSMLDDFGLAATIEWRLKEFEIKSGIKTHFTEPQEDWHLPGRIKTHLYRIFQESLTNIAKHADASQVEVEMMKTDDQLALTIRDNGRGFVQQKATEKESWGIVGMQERTWMIGGDYKIDTSPGKGTTVSVTIPLPKLGIISG